MVALSVSISASISPFFTTSPTCLCQADITPSVMVSLSRGINTTSSILLRSIGAAALLFCTVSFFAETSPSALPAVSVSFVGGFCLSGCALPAGLLPEICCEISSPFLPIIARRSLTCILPPLSAPKWSKVPSL